MERILQVWFLLIPVAGILIMLRDDFNLISKDINLAVKSGILGIFSLILITLALPITIPYSISNILSRFNKR